MAPALKRHRPAADYMAISRLHWTEPFTFQITLAVVRARSSFRRITASHGAYGRLRAPVRVLAIRRLGLTVVAEFISHRPMAMVLPSLPPPTTMAKRGRTYLM